MRTMYLIGGIALLAAGLVYWLASESVGGFLLFAVALGLTVLETLVWLIGRSSTAPAPPVEPQTTSEPHKPPDKAES